MNLLLVGEVAYAVYILCKMLISVRVYHIEKNQPLKGVLWAAIVFFMPLYLGCILFLIKEHKAEGWSKMKNKSLVLIIISIIALGIGIWAIENFLEDTLQYNMKTYQEAQELIQKGWVPETMPEEATEIYNIHNIDTNISHGYFLASPSNINEYKQILQSATQEDILSQEELKSKMWKDAVKKESYAKEGIYYGQDEDFYYAVLDSGKVYYWDK